MHLRINKKIIIYFFLFVIFGTLNNKNLTRIEYLKVEKINISGLDIDKKSDLIKDLNPFKFQNIFFLDETKIKKIIDSNPYVEKFSIFKRYPSEINININTTEFVAYIKKNDGLFFLGSNRKLIKSDDRIEDIPYIFGNFDDNEFFILKDIIENSNFNYSEIKNLYFFPSKRWDIETHSGILIKLPNKKLKESLELSLKILSDIDFKNIKTIDLRQSKQIIINE